MFKSLYGVCAFILCPFFSVSALAEDINFTTSHFSGSGNCIQCHNGMIDSAGADVSIVRDWDTSMMANATKDPFWRAKVATELERNPQLSTLIQDKCTKCHAPVANYEITKVEGGELTLFGADGVLDPAHALYDGAMNGVSCTVCH
ncbi:MAG: multiheme c-type cytochrome, partial [Gammaproteobacteria bacterium]